MSRHYLKNRTIVSNSINEIIADAADYIGIQPVIHRYPTGSEFGTWDIPPRWDVREAWLKDEKGNVIASYKDHPLFLAPYSAPFSGRVSLDVLREHVSIHPTRRNVFYYEHRLAYDAQLRLKDWRITLPSDIYENLDPKSTYEVCIDVDIEPGEMLVAEFILPGKYEETVALLADYCHPGQINDSFSGLAVFMEVFKTLAKRSDRKYTYSLMLFPETIGSSVMLAAEPERISRIKGALFSEMVAWGSDWLIKKTFSGNTYMDLVSDVISQQDPELKTIPFNEGAGNDEIVFDWAGIPSISLQRYPYDEYHSSDDNMDRVETDSMQRAYDITLQLLDVIEKDRVWHCVHPVPFYMSRFNLYNDAVNAQQDFFLFRNLLFNLDGRQSLVEIASKLGMPFNDALAIVEKMNSHGLVRPGRSGLLAASKNHKPRILASQETDNEK